jgi:protein tyrosine phosphatase
VTQDPLSSTTEDFFRMLWERAVPTVVMLSSFEADGNDAACADYIPPPGSTITVGAFTVTHPADAEESLADGAVIKRQLLVRPIGAEPPNKLRSRSPSPALQFAAHAAGASDAGSPVTAVRISHYQLAAWPNDVPASLDAALTLAGTLVATPGPVVVHDGPGAGRAGVFVALHRFFEYVNDPHAVVANAPPFHLPELVRVLRRARPNLVGLPVCILNCFFLSSYAPADCDGGTARYRVLGHAADPAAHAGPGATRCRCSVVIAVTYLKNDLWIIW